MNTKILALAVAAAAVGPVNVAKGAALPPQLARPRLHGQPLCAAARPHRVLPLHLGPNARPVPGRRGPVPQRHRQGPAPAGLEEGQPLRAGVCMTSTQVIGLRSIPAGDPSPAGWALIPAAVPGAATVLDGVTYQTYFRLSAR